MTTRQNRLELSGCFTAITTPFSPDGSRIDFAALARQIDRQADGGVSGIVVSGTTGESPTLEHDEYQQLVAEAVKLGHARDLLVIAGAGSNSTRHAIALQTLAHRLGADATLSVNPYYNKPTQDGLFRHYTAIADSCPIPTILYNVPGRSAGGLTLDTIRTLSRHPNIVAIKDAAGNVDFTSETCAACPNLTVLSGDDPLTLPMMSVGAAGVVSVVSNVVPDRVSAMCAAELEGRHDEALSIHRELAAISKAMFLETNPIPVKGALKLLGVDSGAMRLPMTSATPATLEKLKTLMGAMEVVG
ncbi:MAG: 4-hydroxy-tetrahydrodipicolinate synthase [Phycisphaerales bacterium]|nr:4-hydroxy-tetrahydrodipicolinate synthase [Phycisphaerales bacterium]